MVNKWYMQLGNVNEFKFITQPELLFCSYEMLQKVSGHDLIVSYNDEAEMMKSNIADQQTDTVTIWLRSDQVLNDKYYWKTQFVNVASATYSNSSISERKSLWSARGLLVRERLQDERLFLVRIFDLCLLSWQRVNCEMQPMQEGQSVARDQMMQISHDGTILAEKTLRQLEVHASRALYALWLDAGSVLVAISGTGTIAIREVWSLSDLHYDHDQEAIASSLRSLMDKTEHSADSPLLIGADPEFALINKHNQIVPASKFFDTDSNVHIGADALRSRHNIIYPLVELRPSPKLYTNQLIANIKQLLLEAREYIKDDELRWVAGAMPSPGLALGGHIHFSGIRLSPRLLRMLDGLVAIPLATIEDPLGRGRYRRYGALGDYRRQPHGGFEYRTPPSWLVSPAVTKAALALAYIAMKDYYKLSQNCKLKPEWYLAYDNRDEELLTSASLTILEQIASLPSYVELANDINPLLRAIHGGRRWDERVDIRTRWGISSSSKSGL